MLLESKLFWGAVPTSLTTVYTVAANTRVILKAFDLANTTGANVAVTVHLVASGGTAGTATQLIPAMVLAANEIFQWTGFQVMEAGDTIQVIAGAVGTNIFASGVKDTL